MKPTLGIDIGRVIIHGDGPDTSFIGATDDGAGTHCCQSQHVLTLALPRISVHRIGHPGSR